MSRKRTTALKNRRGITLVLMMMMMSIVIGAAAFAADWGRVYVVRSQLQTGADAAALAGVNALGNNFGNASRDTARHYLGKHLVAGGTVSITCDSSAGGLAINASGQFVPDLPANRRAVCMDSLTTPTYKVGSWINKAALSSLCTGTDPSTGQPRSYPCFIELPDQSDWSVATNPAAANPITGVAEPLDAVQVVSRNTVDFTFGRIFGFTTRQVFAEAVAAWGSANSATCVRPWAIPYQELLDRLYPPAGTQSATSYELTTSDIQRIKAMTYETAPETLKVSTDNGTYTSQSQFYAVNLPPKEYADGTFPATSPLTGANPYRSEEAAQTCGALAAYYASQGVDPRVGVGDWLSPQTGNMQGPTHQGISGQGQTPGICGTSDTCATPIKVIAALWDRYGASPGAACGSSTNNGCYHVKYMAEFTLIGYDQSSKAILGFFNTMSIPADGGGGFTAGGTSTLMVRALVK
jgi:hypothetical protein